MHKTTFLILIAMAVANASFAKAAEVVVTGCAKAGIEAGCVVINDADKTYNISGAKPTPKAGEFGAARGTPSSNPTICQQGIVLQPATWVTDKSKSCND
jgi:hypothetical protein